MITSLVFLYPSMFSLTSNYELGYLRSIKMEVQATILQLLFFASILLFSSCESATPEVSFSSFHCQFIFKKSYLYFRFVALQIKDTVNVEMSHKDFKLMFSPTWNLKSDVLQFTPRQLLKLNSMKNSVLSHYQSYFHQIVMPKTS